MKLSQIIKFKEYLIIIISANLLELMILINQINIKFVVAEIIILYRNLSRKVKVPIHLVIHL